MDWSDVGKAVGKMAPLLGTALGGPVGGAMGAVVAAALGVDATPSAVSQALATDPQAAVKLAEIESAERTRLREIEAEVTKTELTAEAGEADSINSTMREEGKSEHWQQYSWRPSIGFSVASAVILSTITIPVAYISAIFGHTEGLQYLSAILAAEAGVVAMAAPILGIASWHRGRMQVEKGGV